MLRSFIVKYWLEFIFGSAITGLSFGFKGLRMKAHHRSEEQEKIKKGVVAILHDRLYQSGMYFINKGEITVGELNNITEMYEAYSDLGGNSTGTEIYERVCDLDLKK